MSSSSSSSPSSSSSSTSSSSTSPSPSSHTTNHATDQKSPTVPSSSSVPSSSLSSSSSSSPLPSDPLTISDDSLSTLLDGNETDGYGDLPLEEIFKRIDEEFGVDGHTVEVENMSDLELRKLAVEVQLDGMNEKEISALSEENLRQKLLTAMKMAEALADQTK